MDTVGFVNKKTPQSNKTHPFLSLLLVSPSASLTTVHHARLVYTKLNGEYVGVYCRRSLDHRRGWNMVVTELVSRIVMSVFSGLYNI